MQSEGPYRIGVPDEYIGTTDYVSHRLVGPGLGRWGIPEVSDLMPDDGHLALLVTTANAIYAEGRKAAEKEIEEKKVIEDAIVYGSGFMFDGKRVQHEDVYLSEAEIELKKVQKDFNELLELANGMRRCLISDRFDAWKKARGIE